MKNLYFVSSNGKIFAIIFTAQFYILESVSDYTTKLIVSCVFLHFLMRLLQLSHKALEWKIQTGKVKAEKCMCVAIAFSSKLNTSKNLVLL